MDLTPNRVVEGRGDQSWLGSQYGTNQAQSVTLQTSAFVAGTHYPNGYFPAGLPLALYTGGANSGKYGPLAARTVTDAATNSNTTLTSASANFSSADVGASISGPGIPAGTTIASVTNATTVTLSAAATATATGVTVSIAGANGGGTLAGFLFTATAAPRDGVSNVQGALLDHGRVIVSRLPIAPSSVAQSTNPRFIYV